jgi:superfamily II DNA or RNA helicase
MKTTDKKPRPNWRPFEEARVFVHTLGLKNKDEWAIWAKSKKRQLDIPANPSSSYKNAGWINWGDWLGTKNRKGGYRSFKEARAFVRSLKFNGQNDWLEWAKSDARPIDIPANPRDVYADQGWIGMWDWLGTKNRRGHYRPFEEARDFVHSLGLANQKEWSAWAKSDKRPSDIPVSPLSLYKNKGWISVGDWLGTGRIASFNMVYRSFEEARTFARHLGLKKQDDWRKWAQSASRPRDIPAYPEAVYKNKGWISWGDWLGTRNRKGEFRSYKEAHEFVLSLGLQNQGQWRKWIKSEERPYDIPTTPERVYKGKGWINWSDWLGTRNIKTGYRVFEDARKFAQNLGLKNWEEWKAWASSENRPIDIPANPDAVYKNKGWSGMGDWLGTGRVAHQNMIYQPFEDAREFARGLMLNNFDEWKVWAQSEARSTDIPIYPSAVYKDNGWSSWGDWLGTGRVANQNIVYRSFQETRIFARNLKLIGKDDWGAWAKSNSRPIDIPANPSQTYRGKGWMGWADWLGIVNLWNKNAILGFLHGIENVLNNLQPAELYAIMRKNGLIAASKNSNNTNSELIKSIRDLCSSPNPESDFEKLIAEIERENQLLDEGVEEEPIAEVDVVESIGAEELPALRSLQALKAVDDLVQAGITSDDETIEFLIANRVNGLWQSVLNNSGAIDIDTLRHENGGVYFETIQNRFLSQYDSAQSLEIPRGYDFRVKGRIAQPNLMQRLAAYRVQSEKRLGNWSGVGAGKTLSAILASRVIDARLTVIVAFNSTIIPWAKRVIETYPDSDVHIKERGNISVDPKKHTYLILNFETFQQPDSAAMVERLVQKHKIDFVVLDEIQSVKQRTPKVTSKRRQVVSGLLSSAGEKNPDLCVLGMSATPVINNLYEAKALLELVKGVSFDELETFSNIPNAIAMHEKLILYGIRYRPEYKQTIETEFKEIQANEYLPQLTKVRKGAILDLERVLLDAKLETILASLKKGTLIYTHYLTGLVTPLRRAIEKAGFKVGMFTGEDKSGLDAFKKGKVDILIGSVPVGTGVDGLQYVCNRMIVVSLPWTSAEYEQLIGRLYRQGSAFDKVEVIVPQVVLEHNGDIWSWDKMRMNRIQYKKTLADAAMDGVIPEAELSSPETMFKKAREALQMWIQRIEEDGVAIIERAQLRVPLPKETANIIQRRFGDLSMMNSRFNTAYSKTTHERLKQNPEEWYLYHTLYREARKDWAEIPFERIAKSLKKRPDWVIGDFGCGEAKLAKLLPNKVYSFDHVAINENVLACDITHTPLEDGALDVAVFSLSLMGLNYADYFKEAYRTLRFGGLLKIAEPISRWSEKRSELLSTIAEAGFSLVGKVEESNQFLYIDAIKMTE